MSQVKCPSISWNGQNVRRDCARQILQEVYFTFSLELMNEIKRINGHMKRNQGGQPPQIHMYLEYLYFKKVFLKTGNLEALFENV